LAEHLNVSPSTIRNWVRDGVIPSTAYYKVKSVYRFSVPRVEAALLDDIEAVDPVRPDSDSEAPQG
jgi:predicted site-specific integrase-resolvase